MKKVLTLILALILLLALPGCGLLGKLMPKPRSSESMGPGISELDEESDYEEYSEPDYSSEIFGDDYDYTADATIYGQMNAAERAAFIAQAAASGTQVTFNADGSTTFVGDDGSVMTQNADGSWIGTDDEGTTQIGGEWPNNEFTKQVPKPDFGELFGASTQEKSFVVMFTDAKMDDVRAYIEKVKAKGFTINPETTDETAMGVTALSYTAENAAGYKVEIASVVGMNSITISKD